MKAMKKVLSVLVCLCIVLGCASMTAFANETPTGSITVKDQSGTNATVAGKTLNLFKIFDATSNGTNISYKWIVKDGVNLYESFFYGDPDIKDAEGKVIFENRIGKEGNSINDVVAYINSLKDDSYAFSQMASDLHEYIHKKGIDPKPSVNVPLGVTSYKFDDLSLGYYMIYDATDLTNAEAAVRSAAMLAHPGENKEIELKADRPHVEKYVNDNKGAGAPDWKNGTTASIGDIVTFKITTTIPDHALYGKNYTFEISDKMADELELVGNINVTLTAPQSVEIVDDDEHYEVITSQDEIKDATVDFKVVLTDITKLSAGTVVDVTYTAKVLATANANNANTAILTYSNDPNDKTSTGTVDSAVNVHIWQLTLTKYLEGANGAPSFMRLKGAEFEIYKVVDGNEVKLTFSNTTEVTSAAGVKYIKYILDENATNTVLKTLDSGENLDDGSTDVGKTDGGFLGQILIFGLGEGTYRIKEIKAPDGYQKADGAFEFALTDTIGVTGAVGDSSVSYVNPEKPGQFTRVSADSTNVKYYIGITNAPGSALPETGGMGTTLFTILGIIMMAGAAAFFTSRKRSSVA